MDFQIMRSAAKVMYVKAHRLVAEAFIPNPQNLPQVDHIDANGENNSVSNLQWVTASQNIKKSYIQNREQKLAICRKGSLKARAAIRGKCPTCTNTVNRSSESLL